MLFSSSAVEDEPHAFYMEPITAQEAATPPLVANTASAEVINLEIAQYKAAVVVFSTKKLAGGLQKMVMLWYKQVVYVSKPQ